MSLPEQRWWKSLFAKQERKKVDVLKDIEAVTEYLEDVASESAGLFHLLKELEELEKEYHVIRPSLQGINLEAQGKLLDKILERYQYFQNDADVNYLRLKLVAKELLKRAEHSGAKDFVKTRKSNPHWQSNF